MKKANWITGIAGIALAAVLSIGCVTAFAAGADEEAGAEEPAPAQSEPGYLTGQRRSAARNELYAQAAELPEEEQDAFLAENGIADTPYSEEAAESYSYVTGRQRGASFRQSDDSERTQDVSGYGYLTGQQRGASYAK